MGKRMTVKQAATETGLTEYTIRKGIREKRYPHIRTGIGAGKILVDIELLERYLEQEALQNITANPAPAAPNIINYGQLRQVKA